MLERELVREGRHTSQHEGDSVHQHRQSDCRKQTLDDAKDGRGQLVNEAEKGDLAGEEIDVGDDADEGRGQGPEDDHDHDDALCDEVADDALPPLHAEGGPHNLLWPDAVDVGAHVEWAVVREGLKSALCIVESVELDERSWDGREPAGAVLPPQLSYLGAEQLESVASPLDSVDSASKVGERAVTRPRAGGNPLRSD